MFLTPTRNAGRGAASYFICCIRGESYSAAIGRLCRTQSESSLGGLLSLLSIVHPVDIYFADCVVVTNTCLTFCIHAYEGI